MAENSDPKRAAIIEQYIDENLKQVFSQYADEDMPTEITDLLSLLKAQDQSMEKK